MSKNRRPTPQPEPLVTHESDRAPANNPLIQKFVKAHEAFQRAFCKALQCAREAGEALLRLQAETGLKGETLFWYVREQGEVSASNRSFFLYQRIASRWNELSVVAGGDLSDLSLSQAVKLLQQSKEEKPTQPAKEKPATPEAQPETESGSDAAPSPVETEKDADAGDEEPIKVQPPFDQPDKDRHAAVFAQNGPAPTPIQLLTNVVIPSLKRATEGGVSDNEVPFLANAIKEAQALIDMLKQKYAIS